MTEDRIEFWWIGITGWNKGKPMFTDQKVSATTAVGAMTQYDLLDIPCCEVVRYVDDNQLYLFDND